MENRYSLDQQGPVPAGLLKSYRERLEQDLGFISNSKYIKQIALTLPDISAVHSAVTVVGPVGAGRRTVAAALHLSGADWWRPFIEADLAGVDDGAALKLLFGHEEGGIFSTKEARPGLVSLASGSTLCLKNFDRYSKLVQKEVHSLYESSRSRLVFGEDSESLNCRVVFTIQNTPDELRKVGYIDDGIYSMLSEKVIDIPPLSKRKDDIIPLADKFIRECCGEFGLPPKKLSREAERWLKKAPWNKNAVQLKKSAYTACINTGDDVLYPNHFALAHDGNIEDYQLKQLDEISIQSLIEMKLKSFLGRLGKFEATHLHEAILNRVEEPLIRLVLDYAGGNQIKASRILGVNRNTLRTKVKKYNIKVKSG